MGGTNWWALLPIITCVAFCSALPIVNYWYQYSLTKNAIDGMCDDWSASITILNLKTACCYVIALIVSLATYSNLISDTRSVLLNTASVTQFCVSALTLSAFSVITVTKFKSFNGLEFINLFIFSIISVGALLFSSNALSAFFALELLGALTLYSFFVFSDYKTKNIEQVSSNMSNSAIYQLILNFIGSLIFYISMTLVCSEQGTYSFLAPQTVMAEGYPKLYQSAILFSVLIKLGTGPWVFYKFNVYKGFTVLTAVMYNIIYFTSVLVFLYNLCGTFNFVVYGLTVWLSLLLLTVGTLVFSSNVYQVNSVTLFLSFSSLLNVMFMIMQIAFL